MLDTMLIVAVALAAQQQAPVTIVQKTSGWCSPAIANVVGSVTVNCIAEQSADKSAGTPAREAAPLTRGGVIR